MVRQGAQRPPTGCEGLELAVVQEDVLVRDDGDLHLFTSKARDLCRHRTSSSRSPAKGGCYSMIFLRVMMLKSGRQISPSRECHKVILQELGIDDHAATLFKCRIPQLHVTESLQFAIGHPPTAGTLLAIVI
jgi:hypothetical protein